MSFVRKYWIAGLVILLVAIHAVIIGYVRSEATRLKTVASSEIPVGLFYKQSSDRMWLTQLRVHVQVPPERRLAARATIEHNRWVIHEAVEEALRRLDESLLLDPSLVAVKDEIKKAIDEVLHEEIIERIVVNDRVDLDVREFHWRPSQELIMPGEEAQAAKSTTLTSVRPIRPTLSEQNAEHADGESSEEGHGDGEHGADAHGDSEDAGHGKPSGHAAKPAAAHGAAKSSHGAAKPAAKASAHKPASSGHGAPKKKSGH